MAKSSGNTPLVRSPISSGVAVYTHLAMDLFHSSLPGKSAMATVSTKVRVGRLWLCGYPASPGFGTSLQKPTFRLTKTLQ